MTPLAGASQFLSEDNLVGAQCGTPLENRVPSYLKISLNLNGYRFVFVNQSPAAVTCF